MLEQLFISKVRVEIITLFLRNPKEKFHVREIVRRVGTEINAVRRELSRLTRIKFLKQEPQGNKVLYSVKQNFPFYGELLGMVLKESGLGGEIIKQRGDLGEIKFAVIFKDFVKGRVPGSSDVDLLIVGKVSMSKLSAIVGKFEKELGHDINYTAMSEEEFDFRKKRRDPFISKLLSEGKIVLVGDENDFCKLP